MSFCIYLSSILLVVTALTLCRSQMLLLFVFAFHVVFRAMSLYRRMFHIYVVEFVVLSKPLSFSTVFKVSCRSCLPCSLLLLIIKTTIFSLIFVVLNRLSFLSLLLSKKKKCHSQMFMSFFLLASCYMPKRNKYFSI